MSAFCRGASNTSEFSKCVGRCCFRFVIEPKKNITTLQPSTCLNQPMLLRSPISGSARRRHVTTTSRVRFVHGFCKSF
ncbi:hypothetical protein TNCT_345261 [Trichonephila clavata]|uniref:Uncharacterized protein n=1 Tax=Trichonephila clavata TaxID=2740835 RepID=A0A8X6HHA8_TRICU|nr:hypothetical protein TNCT_345261 [Trichonephila clavata]